MWCLENLDGEEEEEKEGARGVKRRKTGEGGEFGKVINIQQLNSSEGVTILLHFHLLPSSMCPLSMPESRWNVRAQGGGSSLVLSN